MTRDPAVEAIRHRFQLFVEEQLQGASAGFTLGQRAWVAEFSVLLVEEVLKLDLAALDHLRAEKEQPPSKDGRFLLNSYGRQCYDRGYQAALDHLRSDTEKKQRLVAEIQGMLSAANHHWSSQAPEGKLALAIAINKAEELAVVLVPRPPEKEI